MQFRSVTQNNKLAILLLVGLLTELVGLRADGAPPVDLANVVVTTADALLDLGRDRWGPEQTALIASLIDRKTGAPPNDLPKGAAGVRKGDRTTPYGSNVNMQQNIFQAFYLLSEIGGDQRYAKAADAALLDFIRKTQAPATGFLAWGEHLCWDLQQDRPATVEKEGLIHELKKPLVFWDYLYRNEPQRMLAYARGIWEHQIGDHQTGNFSRHARYDAHAPRTNYDFTKEAGHFIDIWSRAYAESGEEVFGYAIEVLVGRYAGKLNERNLLDYDCIRKNYCNNGHNITLACELHDAARRVAKYHGGMLSEQMNALARRIDSGFLAGSHRPDVPAAGFIATSTTDTGEPRDRDGIGPGGYSVLWGMGYGRQGTAMVAMHCFRRADQLITDTDGERYRQLALDAAKCYAQTGLPSTSIDVWPVEYGTVILMFLEARRVTGDQKWLEHARRRADEAIALFWDESSPLPRCSSQLDHYETITGTETLLFALMGVHLAETRPDVQLPFSDIDR